MLELYEGCVFVLHIQEQLRWDLNISGMEQRLVKGTGVPRGLQTR